MPPECNELFVRGEEMTRPGRTFQAYEVAREKMADMRKTYVLFKSWLRSLLNGEEKSSFVV